MSSIVPGYNYDIFISYRQKDNKHDGWVTEFVNNLKDELESTFKEEISVYFDINPHDGLLETHDVDESLKDKLKCLIFIPIISRTYCDPKSFAWEHEFKAFVEMASKDQFGLKIKLANGNVANRVLPVRIHDLDNEDKNTCESVLGSVLRGIEFIYKEPGVNKPLINNDPRYPIQINKVANAIKEIFSGLKIRDDNSEKSKKYSAETLKNRIKKSTAMLTGTILVLILVSGGYFVSKILNKEQQEKSIAVLPFKLLSDNPDQQYLADGMMDAITLHLSKIKELRVLGRTSTEQYRYPGKTLSKIGNELEVGYLLEGSYQDYAGNVKLIVQLINTTKGGNIWGNEYSIKGTEILTLQSDVAKAVAAELNAAITPQERQLIEKLPTTNLTAYDFYQKGKAEEINFSMEDPDDPSLKRSELMYRKALAHDSLFAAAYAGLAMVNIYEHYNKEYYSQNFLDSFLILINKSISIDPKLPEAHYLKGVYHILTGDPASALNELDICLRYNPNYWQAYDAKANWIYGVNCKDGDYIEAIENTKKAISLNHGKEHTKLIRSLGMILGSSGFSDLAIKHYQTALSIDNDSISYYSSLTGLFTFTEYRKAEEYNVKWLSLDPGNFNAIENLGDLMVFQGDFKTALKHHISCSEWIRQTNQLGEAYMHRIGYTYWLNGNKEEAHFWFRKQKKFNLTTIENNRYSASISPTSYYDLACVYAFEGKKDSAYLYMRKLDEMKVFPAWWISCIKNDPLLESLRKDKEFQGLVNRLESKYQAEHERVRKWLKENNML